MAESGSFNTTKYGSRYLTFSWSIKSQSIANNTTTISWSLKGAGGDTSLYYMSGNFKVVIDGTTVYSSDDRIKLFNGTTVASGTFTMSHDSLGEKTFSASAEAGIYTYAVNCTGSGSWTLTQIPRYASVTQNLSSKTETTLSIRWASDSVIDYIYYSSDNGSTWTDVNVADGTSGTYIISGLSANTTYYVKTRVRRKDSQLTTDSTTLPVSTYPYPYANSMPSFVIGSMLTVGLYNPLGRTVTVNVIAEDNREISGGTTSGASISGYNDLSAVNLLYASIPNARSGQYRVKVSYGSESTTSAGGDYTVNESVCAPEIASVSYRDVNAASVAITRDNQDIVQNQSQVQYAATGLTAKNSALVVQCQVSVNGNVYDLTVSGSSASGGSATIDSGSDVEATFTVTDSRGLQTTKTLNISMLAWSIPSAIITMQRRNNYYSETDLTVDANYASINGNNTVTIQYRYKKTEETTWSSYFSAQDNVTTTFTADNTYEWDVQVVISDRFGGTVTYNLNLQIGMPIIYFDRLKSSTGFNCFPKGEKTVEVNGINVVKSIVSMSLSANITNLSVNSFTIIPLNLSVSAGDGLTATQDGGIRIGANVSKILVSGRVSLTCGIDYFDNRDRQVRIVKNSYSAANTLAWALESLKYEESHDLTITPVLASVTPGDVIYMMYSVPDSGDVLNGDTYGTRTMITVETVG